MPISRGRGDKLEPTDNNKQSDTNKLPDESDTDHTALSDCSSEDGSLNRQSLNDAASSTDSGHGSDCMSEPSTLCDVTSSSVNDSTSNSSDPEHPLTSLSSHDSDYSSIASDISDILSSHSSPKSDSVARKGTNYSRTNDKKKTKSSFNSDIFVDKVQHKSLDHKVQRYRDKVKSVKKHAISHVRHKFLKEEPRNIERKKQEFTTHIPKHLLPNTDYADDADYTDVMKRVSLAVEKLERLKQYPVKDLVKEVEELIKLAATGNAADFIAAIKGCLEYLKSELAAGRLTDDHLANYLVKKLPELILLTVKNMTLEKEINNSVYGKAEMMDDSRLAPFELDVSDVNGHQSNDDQYLEYLRESMDKMEKNYSTLKKIRDCKYFQNGMYRQDVTVMSLLNGSSDGE